MDKTAIIAGLLTLAAGAIVVSEASEALKRTYRAVEQCAQELKLIPSARSQRPGREAALASARPASRPVPTPNFSKIRRWSTKRPGRTARDSSADPK